MKNGWYYLNNSLLLDSHLFYCYLMDELVGYYNNGSYPRTTKFSASEATECYSWPDLPQRFKQILDHYLWKVDTRSSIRNSFLKVKEMDILIQEPHPKYLVLYKEIFFDNIINSDINSNKLEIY